MTDFWTAFDRACEEGKASDVGKVMTAEGYTISHTGGGCMTWEKVAPSGHYVWICDEGSGLGDRLDETYLTGLYSPDGDYFVNGQTKNLADAIAWCRAINPASLITPHDIAEAADKSDLDEACRYLQGIANVQTGDVAGQVFSGLDDGDWEAMSTMDRAVMLHHYVDCEKRMGEPLFSEAPMVTATPPCFTAADI